MNPDLSLLQPYPFEKLNELLKGITPASLPPVSLSVGEPRHPAPQLALDALISSIRKVENYPPTKGSEALRQSMAQWICSRFSISHSFTDAICDNHVIPVNGTREGLFAIAQCLLNRQQNAKSVLMPNPFYQIYEGAALLAGCQPEFYAISNDADADLQSISDEQFEQCQLIYICTPGNPTGAVNSKATLQWLINKAHTHDFIIVSDECYSEIYRDAQGAPCGLLQAASDMGLSSFDRCIVFHSLSKRSNLPGLRSGFTAGDKRIIKHFVDYRTYHGGAMSGVVQDASMAAWSDESHVIENRQHYDEKYQAVVNILAPALDVKIPPAGFYLWPRLPCDDQVFTQQLLKNFNVRAVPGSYLARAIDGRENPGSHRLRLALVAPLEDCKSAAERIVACLNDSIL